MSKLILAIVVVIVLVGSVFFWQNQRSVQPVTKIVNPSSSPTVTWAISPAISPSSSPSTELALPISNFKARITKKTFGMYITAQNSPVQPERFTGYHTGIDVEYTDVSADVPVFAVNDGIITLSETASGYGGVFILKTEIAGQTRSVLYGHIRPASLPKVGKNFVKGEQIAVLGTGYSPETDGERRHLHFAVLTDTRLDIKGYVQTKSALSGWFDPLIFYDTSVSLY